MDRKAIYKKIKVWLPWILLVACLVLALATGGFGSRALRKENKDLERERNVIQKQKIHLLDQIGNQAEVIESFEEIRSKWIYQDSVKAVQYELLIVNHEKDLENLLSLPTDSVYRWTKQWIRAKSQ